jgi:hypothetical protein
MTQRLFIPAAVATTLCLTTTAVMAQTPATTNAERSWSAIERCAQEDSERARHTCMDGVLREAGLLTNEMRAEQERRAFGLDDKPVRTPPRQPAPAPTPQVAAATPPTATASPPASAPSPQVTAPSLPPAAARTSTDAPPPAPVQPDRLDVERTKVEKAVSGRFLVTTTDGAVWLQTESVEMPQPPVAGDRMSIRKGSLGGYRCSVASTHLTYRCARSR